MRGRVIQGEEGGGASRGVHNSLIVCVCWGKDGEDGGGMGRSRGLASGTPQKDVSVC